MKEIAKQFNFENLKIDKRMFNDVYFKQYNDYSHRYNIYYGGRNSGKTYAICDLLILKGLKEKRNMLWMVKQSARVEGSIWRLALSTLEKFEILEYCTINISTKTIILPITKTTIKMTGLDDDSKAKLFFDISDIWLDEANNFTEAEVDTLDGTLRGKCKNKQMFLSFNPVSKASFLYKKYGFNTGIIPDDTFILKTTWMDNKFLDKAEIKRLKNLEFKDPIAYQIECLGNFVTLNKKIFNYTIEKLDTNKLLKNNPDLICLIGMDFGFVDPTSVIMSLYDKDKKILYIMSEIYQRGLTNSQIADLIKKKGWHKNVIIADCANPKDILDLKKIGIDKIKPCKKGAGSIMSGIKKMKEMNIIINESCENVILEFDNYAWKKDKDGNYIDEPIGDFNHCIDAIRYSCQAIRKQVKLINIRL